MGGPFLVEGFETPEARRAAIADEVQYFLMAELGMDLPPDVQPCQEVPEALLWLLKVEQWGLLMPGSYLEQPAAFMRDIEMARIGRNQAYSIKEVNDRNREVSNANQNADR